MKTLGKPLESLIELAPIDDSFDVVASLRAPTVEQLERAEFSWGKRSKQNAPIPDAQAKPWSQISERSEVDVCRKRFEREDVVKHREDSLLIARGHATKIALEMPAGFDVIHSRVSV